MEIQLSVGDEVMAPVMGRPPEWPFLVRRRSRKRDQELEQSTGPVRAMCQEAMKAGGNRKHAHHIQSKTSDYCHRADACPEHQQTREMHEEKLHADGIVQFVLVKRGGIVECGGVCGCRHGRGVGLCEI